MKHTHQLAIFLLILISITSCFTSEISINSLSQNRVNKIKTTLDPNSKFNGFQDINLAHTGDEGVFVDIDDSTVYRDQINYRKTPNLYSYRKDYLFQLSQDLLIDKPMARLSFKLDIPFGWFYAWNNYYTFCKIALIFGNNETEIGFAFNGKADRSGLGSGSEYEQYTVTGTVFNVPIGVHPIKFKLINQSNISWLANYFNSNGNWGNQYPMMDVEGEFLKPAKVDKKAPLILPKEETSQARPTKRGRFVSTGFYYSWPYTLAYNNTTKRWRYSYRMPWSQYNWAWAAASYSWRKVHQQDATEGETFAMFAYYPNSSVQASIKGSLSYYDKEGWWAVKHTDESWMCNSGPVVTHYNNNSWYKLKNCAITDGKNKNASWKKMAWLTQAKWLTYSYRYKYFFYFMYTIPKNTTKSSIYISPEHESTIKITAKGKTLTLKKAKRHEVQGVFEKDFKKALKSKDTITIEVDSGKKVAFLTGVINYKDSTGKIRLLSADLYMKCGKGQQERRILSKYTHVNAAPLITLLSDRAKYFVGTGAKKVKCTIKLP